jgi:hypothetical protein
MGTVFIYFLIAALLAPVVWGSCFPGGLCPAQDRAREKAACRQATFELFVSATRGHGAAEAFWRHRDLLVF